MPRPRDPNKKVPLSIRLRPVVKQRIVDEAKRLDISASELVAEAVGEHLKRVVRRKTPPSLAAE